MRVNIDIDVDTFMNLVCDRVGRWCDNDPQIKALYKDMYQSMLEGGVFDNEDSIDLFYIIDNDCINYCKVIYEGEMHFNELLKLSKTEHYINPDYNLPWSYIESVSKDKKMILVRY